MSPELNKAEAVYEGDTDSDHDVLSDPEVIAILHSHAFNVCVEAFVLSDRFFVGHLDSDNL